MKIFKQKINFNSLLFLSVILLSSLVLVNQSWAIDFPNPLTSGDKALLPAEIYGGIIQAILGLVGSLALVFFIWGGFLWMTAGGNTEQVEKGKQTFLWATLGLVSIFTSYAVLKLVISSLVTSTIQ